jgi:hypothetical protein
VGWISNHILLWPISPLLLPFLMRGEACYILHRCNLEECAIIWRECLWFPSTCYEISQGSKEYLSSETCDNFNVDILWHKAYKYSNITFCYCLAVLFPIAVRWVQLNLHLL